MRHMNGGADKPLCATPMAKGDAMATEVAQVDCRKCLWRGLKMAHATQVELLKRLEGLGHQEVTVLPPRNKGGAS